MSMGKRTHRWASVGTLCATLAFVLLAAGTVRSFIIRDGVQWCPPVERGFNGVGARLSTYEACVARGVVCFDVTRDQWTTDDVGRNAAWLRYTFRPDSLFTDPTTGDVRNIRFAGFQYYHGVFSGRIAGLQAHTVHSVIVPLWPLLILTAIPPVAWWVRRRRDRRATLTPESMMTEAGDGSETTSRRHDRGYAIVAPGG